MKDGDFSLNAEFDEIRNMPNESVISDTPGTDAAMAEVRHRGIASEAYDCVLANFARKLERELNQANASTARLREELAESERDHEQLVNYLTAKLGTNGEHSVFETIDNVVARLAKLEAENQQRKQDCIAAVQSVLEARDLLSPGTNLSLKEAVAAWRKAASPVTDNPKEDAFYEKVENQIKKGE